MIYRPYQQEAARLELQESIKAFECQRQPKPKLKVRNSVCHKLSIKEIVKQEKISQKRALRLFFSVLLITACLSSCLLVKAQINEKTRELNTLEKSNQILDTQNQILENTLVSNIDGKSYYDYIICELGMSPNNQKIHYINSNEYEQDKN